MGIDRSKKWLVAITLYGHNLLDRGNFYMSPMRSRHYIIFRRHLISNLSSYFHFANSN